MRKNQKSILFLAMSAMMGASATSPAHIENDSTSKEKTKESNSKLYEGFKPHYFSRISCQYLGTKRPKDILQKNLYVIHSRSEESAWKQFERTSVYKRKMKTLSAEKKFQGKTPPPPPKAKKQRNFKKRKKNMKKHLID